ncbi:hypothetical protein ACHAXR_001919 [Thalassiosira sp. AJA248-18]
MFLSSIGGITALLTTGGFLLRRKISRKWITRSSICVQQFTKEQTIIITGGNTGLGYEAAKDLASCGGKVILACRNNEAAERAALQIRECTGNEEVNSMKLDLSSLDSVRAFATELKARNEKVYALICNAGVWVPDSDHKNKTQDGYEIHFGINHLGHFALIQSLIPQMEQKGVGSRIIIVSSALAKSGKIDLQKRDFVYEGRNPEPNEKKSFAPTGYCDSKLMNMLTCRELAEKLHQTNTSTYAVSPGFCHSKLGRNVQMPIYKKMILSPLMRLFQRSSAQGAQNIMFAVMEDKSKLKSGAMYQDGVIWEDGAKLIDTLGDDLQKRLWELSEELVKEE